MSDFTPLADAVDVDRGVVVRGGRRFCFHWFRSVGVKGMWSYHECRCGRRKATRLYANLMGPLDWEWLHGNA